MGHRLCPAELAALRIEQSIAQLVGSTSDRLAIAVISRIAGNAVNQENLREPHMRGSGDAADNSLDSNDTGE
jgi:hypothetical protein